jgi:hypothetical protein
MIVSKACGLMTGIFPVTEVLYPSPWQAVKRQRIRSWEIGCIDVGFGLGIRLLYFP